MATHVVLKIGQDCPYLDGAEYTTCAEAEFYCESNVGADTHCGGLFSVQGCQVSAHNPVFVEEGDEELDDDDDSPMYGRYVRTFREVLVSE